MARRLVGYVYVSDDQGVAHQFGPGSVPPAWAAARITNPKAWGGDDEDTVEMPVPASPPPPEGAPPRKGPRATRHAWATFADTLGVTYPVDASRDVIIAAVDNK